MNLQTGPFLFQVSSSFPLSKYSGKNRLKVYSPECEVKQSFQLHLYEPRESLDFLTQATEFEKNWKVQKKGDVTILQIYCGIIEDYAIQINILETNRIEVFTLNIHPHRWNLSFLLTSALRWIASNRIIEIGGVMLHGALIDFHKKGLVATGPSGAGKTTISSFFSQKGYSIFTDETLFLLPEREGIFAYGSPWHGLMEVAKNKKVHIKEILFLKKSQTNELKKINKKLAQLLLMKEIFIPRWNQNQTEQALENLNRIVENLEHYELSFCKNLSVVEFMEQTI